jgi:HlyD family secretion protein
VPVDANLTVQALETSVLRAVLVRPGQVVKRGDELARLDPTFAAADAGQQATRIQALEAELQRLHLELGLPDASPRGLAGAADQQRLFKERQAALNARRRQNAQVIARLESSLATNRAEQGLLSERVDALRDLETMNQSLEAQQFVARARVLETRERRLEVEREASTATLREREIRDQILAAKEELDTFVGNWRSESAEALARVRRELAEARQSRTKAALREELSVLRAPADGVVLEVSSLSVGSVLREAETVVTLVRSGSALEVEVEAEPADIGFLAAGQPARIKLDAFPFQKHGVLQATVTSVGRDAVSSPQPQLRGQRMVPLRMALQSPGARGPLPAGELTPGMLVTAEVVTGRRSVLSYFTYPLIRLGDEGLRER